ncbi:hypothetical protein [Natronorarus salvus]|uniref:hypothetical protein n=1 Tax=Natronorarus salvus TaxID=3117733 RepID=UPI002F262B7A
MGPGSEDPRVIRSVAVTAGDVVTAYEATVRGGRETVLRITPPFVPRERARLHVPGPDEPSGDPAPIHLAPGGLLDTDALGPFPTPDDTAAAMEEAGERYSPDRHHERHLEAVERWRARARGAIVEEVTLELPDGRHPVEVKALGVC